MNESDIVWNDEARAKILSDSDRVLREAVLELAETEADSSWEDLFAELHARLKDRFIDFEPGPDLRKYAEAIAGGEFAEIVGSAGPQNTGGAGEAKSSGSSEEPTGAESPGEGSNGATAPTDLASTDPAVNSTGTADGVVAAGVDGSEGDDANEVVNDG